MEAVRQAGLRAKATASDARGNEPRADLGDETRAETAASDARGSGPRTDLGDEARRRAYLEGVQRAPARRAASTLITRLHVTSWRAMHVRLS